MKLPGFKALNREEIAVGFCVGLSSAVKIGWWAIPVALSSAYLWAAGGAKGDDGGKKAYRRIGVPAVWVVVVAAITHDQWILTAWLPAHGVCRIGYGIPTTQPPDPGSFLGRVFYGLVKRFKQEPVSIIRRQRIATILTRVTTYALLAIALFSTPVLAHYLYNVWRMSG